jgi:hypothetical protein
LPDLFDFLNWWAGTNTTLLTETIDDIAEYGYSV